MEQFNRKIFAGTSLGLKIATIFLVFYISINTFADNILKNVSMSTFTSPKYNESTGKLEYILSGKNAKTIGAFIRINDARLELIGPDGFSVERVITTPEAFFNRATQIIRGDKPIHYESLAAIIDGVGFDCNMNARLFHVRNNVKMIILSVDALQGNDTNKLKEQIKNNNNKTTPKPEKTEQGIIRETSSE